MTRRLVNIMDPPIPPLKLERPLSITLHFSPREDGGLRIWSDDVPGLILSHSDQDAAMADLGPALAALLSLNATISKS